MRKLKHATINFVGIKVSTGILLEYDLYTRRQAITDESAIQDEAKLTDSTTHIEFTYLR
jgi:hypothetical protein